jgi:hypothetical protein
MLKNLSIPANVEKYPLTAKLDQRGESPSFGHGRGLPKCIVENRDAIGDFTFAKGWKQKNSHQETTRRTPPKQDWQIAEHCSPTERVQPRPMQRCLERCGFFGLRIQLT